MTHSVPDILLKLILPLLTFLKNPFAMAVLIDMCKLCLCFLCMCRVADGTNAHRQRQVACANLSSAVCSVKALPFSIHLYLINLPEFTAVNSCGLYTTVSIKVAIHLLRLILMT